MQSAVDSAASEDRDVIELLRADGRERAFALLLPRYELKIYRLCCALLRDPTQAQDAAQESLVRIWKALPGYDGAHRCRRGSTPSLATVASARSSVARAGGHRRQ